MKKTALVTGASTGIGWACVEYLLANDYIVYAGARKAEDLEKLESLGAAPLKLDVSDEKQVIQALKEFEKSHKGLDVLINNAGIAIAGPLELVPLETYKEQFAVNVFGLISVTQKFLPLLRKNKGHIVNISSIAGRLAGAFMTPYSASKFGVEAVSDGLRRELKYFGVKVTLIEPGPIATPIWKKSQAYNDSYMSGADEKLKSLYKKPMDRFRKEVENAAENAVSVNKVIACIDHALTSPSGKTRYLVGAPAKIAGMLVKVFPDKILDKILVRGVL